MINYIKALFTNPLAKYKPALLKNEFNEWCKKRGLQYGYWTTDTIELKFADNKTLSITTRIIDGKSYIFIKR